MNSPATSFAGPRLADLQVGQEIPAVRLAFPLTRVVASAIATRDYQAVHHDLERARLLGSRTVFINTHTAAGCLERVVMSWAGPNAFLKSLKLRLGVAHYAGDELLLKATITALDRTARLVTLDVVGTNALGDHVTGVVVVRLPEPSDA